MGKAKRKSKHARADPRGDIEQDVGEEKIMRTEDQIINNIMEQLQSSNAEDKVCGCQSIGNLSSLDVIQKLILSKKLIKAVAPLFLEKDDMVQISALGALRNVSSVNTDIAEEMVNQDVMTPLEFFLNTLKGQDQANVNLKQAHEAFNLLWNLIEASPTASSILTKSSELLNWICGFLNVGDKDVDLVITVLNLLSSACDQNELVSNQVLGLQHNVQEFLNHPNLKLRMASLVLLTTLLEDKILETSFLPSIFQILSQTISRDSRKEMCDLSSSTAVNDDSDNEMETENENSSAENECLSFLGIQQTALEIVANLCSGSDDSDEWQDDDSNNNEEDDKEFMEQLSSSEEAVETIDNIQDVNPVLIEALTANNLVNIVLAKANPLPENVKQIFESTSKGRRLLKAYTALRMRSFLCVSNMLEILTVADFGGAANLFATWNSLGTQLVADTDEQLMEATSSCMRSVTAKLCKDKEGKSVMNISEKELEAIVNVGQKTDVPEIRMNIVNMIGDISILLASSLNSGGSADVFKVLIAWLMDGGCKDSDLRVVTESLDKLFDAFSEDYTDQIFFKHLNLLPKFKAVENSFKIKLKMQKHELSADSLGIINMAKLNLKRFIKYKEKRSKLCA